MADTEQVMHLDLTSAERAVLTEILDSEYRDLKEEINKTDTREFKEQLKTREAVILRLLNQLGYSFSS